jgi:hypothetical protein
MSTCDVAFDGADPYGISAAAHLRAADGLDIRVDISRYLFFPEEVLTLIRRINGYPQLSAGFESSVPSLHFLDAPVAWSFGPRMRFVAGAEFASSALTESIVGRVQTRRS